MITTCLTWTEFFDNDGSYNMTAFSNTDLLNFKAILNIEDDQLDIFRRIGLSLYFQNHQRSYILHNGDITQKVINRNCYQRLLAGFVQDHCKEIRLILFNNDSTPKRIVSETNIGKEGRTENVTKNNNYNSSSHSDRQDLFENSISITDSPKQKTNNIFESSNSNIDTHNINGSDEYNKTIDETSPFYYDATVKFARATDGITSLFQRFFNKYSLIVRI